MIIIKTGGGEGNAMDPVLDDLATLSQKGERWILVHGGSARTNEIATALGHPPEFVTSPSGFESRRTDRRTAEIFAMVYAGDVNSRLVEGLQTRGVNALGLSGLDGRLLEGPRKKAIRVLRNGRAIVLRDDYTGIVERVNNSLLTMLLETGYAPVLSPPALSTENEILNVDGDRAAAAIAAAMKSDTLVLLTGAPGLLRDPSDPESLVPNLARSEVESAIETWARGRMRLKLFAAREALEKGVGRVIISASDTLDPVQSALEGRGTTIA